eukprot:1727534-Rhodomonas_salina.1
MCLDAFARHKATKERIKVLLKALYTSFRTPEVQETVKECWKVLDLGSICWEVLDLGIDPEVTPPAGGKASPETGGQCCGSVRSAAQKCVQWYQQGLQWCEEKVMGKPPGWK